MIKLFYGEYILSVGKIVYACFTQAYVYGIAYSPFHSVFHSVSFSVPRFSNTPSEQLFDKLALETFLDVQKFSKRIVTACVKL